MVGPRICLENEEHDQAEQEDDQNELLYRQPGFVARSDSTSCDQTTETTLSVNQLAFCELASKHLLLLADDCVFEYGT